MRFPSAGLNRVYLCGAQAHNPDEMLAGSSAGELVRRILRLYVLLDG